MNGLPRKGQLKYAQFIFPDDSPIPEIELVSGLFDYDLDNIGDTHQRLVELEKKVYRGVNDIKPFIQFDMWNTVDTDTNTNTQKILQLIRGCGQV